MRPLTLTLVCIALSTLSSLICVAPAAAAPATLKPVISEQVAPVVVIEAPTTDGHKATAVMRTPPGEGRLPVVIILHGGLHRWPVEALKDAVLTQPTPCRLFAAGYITVAATFRSRREDPQTRNALIDCLAIIDHVRKLPHVDPMSIVIFGTSGGGSLALELAGETELCAISAGEPANILFTGMLTRDSPDLNDIQNHPAKYYTNELRQFTEEKISRINCPIQIIHSNLHPINKVNDEIVIPALRAAGKHYEVVFFPGYPHGFYHGYNSEVGLAVFDALAGFFSRHVVTKPKPIDPSLISFEPLGRPNPRFRRDGDPTPADGDVPRPQGAGKAPAGKRERRP